MGTRHLVVVYDDEGTLRVAQYGQWDGYPEGQGIKVLEAARDKTLEERARGAVAVSYDQIKEYWVEAGADPGSGSVSMDVSNKFRELYPALSRDTGADVLKLLPCEVRHDLDFAADGLFCEWAYVIDYQQRVLEVYAGFNRVEQGPAEGRFANMTPENAEFTPVTLVQSWPLDDLPDQNVFLNRLCPDEQAA